MSCDTLFGGYGMNRRGENYAAIASKLRTLPLDTPSMRYEWEELVTRLCASNDDVLREIGMQERVIIQRDR